MVHFLIFLFNCGKIYIRFTTLTTLKHTVQLHWIHSVLCNHHHYFQYFFITLNRNPILTGSFFHSPSPSPRRQLICFLSLWICQFWIFLYKWNYATCTWFLSFSIFVRFIRVAACKSVLYSCSWLICMDIPHWFIHSQLSVSIWVISTWWLMGIEVLQTFEHNFCLNTSFQFFWVLKPNSGITDLQG